MKKTAWLKFPPPDKQLHVADAKMCCHITIKQHLICFLIAKVMLIIITVDRKKDLS